MGHNKRRKKTAASAAVADTPSLFTEEELTTARQKLLQSVEDDKDSPRPLLKLFLKPQGDRNQRQQRQLLLTAVENFKKPLARRFFAGLSGILQDVLQDERYVPESAFQHDEAQDNNSSSEGQEDEIQPDASSSEHLHFLQYAALLLHSYVDFLALEQSNSNNSNKTNLNVIEEAFQVAQALHDVLLALQDCGPDAIAPQSAILALCETWWQHQANNAPQLVPRALGVLVTRALDPEATQATLKRLFVMRHAFEWIDFHDADSAELKETLLRVASSPVCLKQTLGRRFVAHLLQLDELTVSLHAAMKVQMTPPTKTILEAYGEIYFRAWKEAPEEQDSSRDDDNDNDNNDDGDDDDNTNSNSVRRNLETNVLNELMYAVLHAAHPTMSNSLLQILKPFHNAQTNPAVEDMLHRVYNPILFRATASTNAQIRLQATRVLAQVFPLQDASHTQTERCLTKSCATLETLLQDVDPRVRVAASKAVAQVLSTFWTVLEPAQIRTLLEHIVTKHASDASSAMVRAGALDSVALLLQAPQSHAVLRPLLPGLGNLIHDKVERVRTATVRLLLAIKKIHGIKYYHVVPVDHLMARLVADPHNSVASSITALMINSYFPSSASDQIQRCLRFLSQDPAAASVFYANVAQHLPLNAVAQLAVMLIRCLHAAIRRERKQRLSSNKNKRLKGGSSSDTASEQKDDSGDDVDEEGLLSAADTGLMASLTETIDTLWESIEEDLEEEEPECYQFLHEYFSGTVLTDALTHFEEKASREEKVRADCHRTCSAILRLAGRLPSSAVKGMMEHVSSSILSVTDDSNQAAPTAELALFCLWGRTDAVASALAASIESDFESYHELLFASPEANSKKRKSGRSGKRKTQDVPHLPPSVALEVLGDFLRGADPSSAAARRSLLASEVACGALEQALERGTKHAERLLAGDSDYSHSARESEVQFILRVCEAYGRFVLHKEASRVTDSVKFNDQASSLLHWTTSRVVPALLETSEDRSSSRLSSDCAGNVPFNDPDLSSIAIEKSFDWPSSPIPTGPSRRRTNRNSTPVRFSTESGFEPRFSNAVGRAFALSLLQSSCIIFSEWLAVGGAGASEIDAAAAGWCAVLETKSQNDDDANDDVGEVQSTLLPSLSRLAMQLSKTCQQFSLLRNLLSCCQESKDEMDTKEVLGKTISSLLASRGNQATCIIQKTVESVLHAAHVHLDRQEMQDDVEYELPASMTELWSADNGSIAVALTCVFRSKSASVELAEQLVKRFASRSADDPTARALFYIQCLFLLCDGSISKAPKEAAACVRQLDQHKVDADSQLGSVLNELMEGVV